MTPNEIHSIVQFVKNQIGEEPAEVGIILGSGLGFFAKNSIDVESSLYYEEIPGFPQSTVAGHAGRLISGRVEGRRVLCFQGRFHFYEGYGLDEVVIPVRLLAGLGVPRLFLTNAAGGIRADLVPGDLMRITDHINALGSNPLIGPNDDSHGPRFPDMTDAWDPELGELLENAAKMEEIRLQTGVYLATTGPSYETPAEVRAFRTIGADAVGMSTVPECIAARHAGIQVCGISCITNIAAGLGSGKLSHEEVSDTALSVEDAFARLVTRFVTHLPS